jgi:peptide/nickel transport system ATP-binding protein
MSAEGERQEPAKEAPSDRKKRERNADDIILSVRNLNVSYPIEKSFFGKTKKVLNAVDDISFDVVRGETLGLVGESGCGKTTLGRALLRLVDSASGSVTFDGQRLDTLSPKALRQLRPKMQIIFQDPYSSLNPRLTVGQTIMEPLSVYAKGTSTSRRREKVKELMQRVGLEPAWYDRYPHEFSGGQRQRVCIARALVLNPELVICDESVSALDVSVQAQVLNLLADLQRRRGLSMLFITHDLAVVRHVAHTIAVMRAGRIVEQGPADRVLSSPAHPYTRELLAACLD